MDSNIIKSHTLFREVDLIKENFNKVNNALPDVYMAGEMINDQFDQLITTNLKNENPSDWQFASLMMVFGSHQSWINSYIMTSVGFSDIGLMALRRSIEFACYLAKVNQSDDRAKLWMGKGEKLENKKHFSNIFSIPQKYFHPKYSYLKHLLVLHNYPSDFGIHANYEVLINKLEVDKNKGNYIVSFQDIRKNVDTSLGMVLLSGYRILQSIIHTLESEIYDHRRFLEKFENVSEIVRKARLKIAEREFNGNIPHEIISNINSDNEEAIKAHYQELVNRHN